ncbi:MFS transporter [Plantactinospora sp. KLBMP9567]|uniref:MFS transporter n=1 Tax=Plantactinospora sp. KLBMP9567 TaxID=3085900 RepID=UPI002981C974|nr:MFS transporter [Plantactinospora sp. KLBMP9567]MDW5329367.1 MFS transporter [Plantactinospora sp. KLBMP9567]
MTATPGHAANPHPRRGHGTRPGRAGRPPVDGTPPTPPRGPLWVLLLGSTLTVLAGAVLAPVVELLRSDLGVSAGAAGLVLTAHGLSLALVGPLVGRAVDRWGVPGPLAAGLVVYGLAGGAGLLLDDYVWLVASRLVFGIGAAAVFTGTTLGLLDLAEGAARDRMMGWRTTAISLGGVLWPLLGGALGTISWHAPFAVYLVGVPLGLAALRLLSTTDASRPVPRAAPAPPVCSADAARPRPTGGAEETTASAAVGDRVSVRPGSLLRGRPGLLGIYALQAVATALLYGVLVFLPPRLAEVGVRDSFRVALFGALLSLVMSLTGLRFARVRARLGWSGLLLLAFGAWTVALLVLALGTSPVPLLIAPAVFGFGMGLAVPALTVLAAEHAPADRRGQATALLGTATFASQFGSPLLFGPVEAATSPSGVFLAAAALAALTLLAVLATGRRLANSGRSRGTFPSTRRWK